MILCVYCLLVHHMHAHTYLHLDIHEASCAPCWEHERAGGFGSCPCHVHMPGREVTINRGAHSYGQIRQPETVKGGGQRSRAVGMGSGRKRGSGAVVVSSRVSPGSGADQESFKLLDGCLNTCKLPVSWPSLPFSYICRILTFWAVCQQIHLLLQPECRESHTRWGNGQRLLQTAVVVGGLCDL